MQNFKRYDNHDMISHDTCYEDNRILTCHDSKGQSTTNCSQLENRISKDEWYFLVQTLESWHVFNPRAIVKKNPAAAWKCMNLCKDRNVRVKGAYFTACFRTELAKQKAHQNFVNLLEKKCGVA